MARLYYRLLKDLGVFASAEERAADARSAAEAAAKKKADAAEKARQDAERRAFQSAGLPYTAQQQQNPPATTRPSASSATTTTAASAAGFVESIGADLADNGVGGLKGMLKKIREAGGGVLFVDEVIMSIVLLCGGAAVCGTRAIEGGEVLPKRCFGPSLLHSSAVVRVLLLCLVRVRSYIHGHVDRSM